MSEKSSIRFCFAVTAALAAMAVSAQADSFSFTGALAVDDEVQLFDFAVGAESTVQLRSFSYGGGTQADGNVVSAGGFDPILALFDSTGMLIDQNDDADGPPVLPDNGNYFDVYLEALLSPGSYRVAVSQYDNFANGPDLSDGFLRAGEGDFTGADFDCSNGSFCDVDGDNRTSAWAFDILGVDNAVVVPPTPGPSPVPLPATLPLLAAAMGLFGAATRRRRAKAG